MQRFGTRTIVAASLFTVACSAGGGAPSASDDEIDVATSETTGVGDDDTNVDNGGGGTDGGSASSSGPADTTAASGSGTGGSSSSSSAPGGSPSGGTSSSGGGPTTGAGGGSTSGTGSGVTTSAPGPGSCESVPGYPAGPYGKQNGDTVDGSLSFDGFPELSRTSSEVSHRCMSGYYDPNGSKGIKALVIEIGATWCPGCNQLAGQLTQLFDDHWKGTAVHELTLLYENGSHQPAAPPDAWAWYAKYDAGHAAPVSVVAAPKTALILSGGIPQTIIIDPRTMKIVQRAAGSLSVSTIDQLAAR
jgi:hypothetical protein